MEKKDLDFLMYHFQYEYNIGIRYRGAIVQWKVYCGEENSIGVIVFRHGTLQSTQYCTTVLNYENVGAADTLKSESETLDIQEFTTAKDSPRVPLW